jgi:tRNA 5-methylaminomethyl-2-thiouridine biosynthesis bifunctional protein
MSAPQAAVTVPAARLAWRDDQPVSLEFGDIYHAADGVAEVERVFLGPNRFDERAAAARGWLRVGELGFGSGLNFVTAAERFVARAAAPARLHFVSCDARPIDPADFDRLAARRATHQPLYRELARVYPPRLPGWHRRTLADGRVDLSVFWGDVSEALADLAGHAPPFDAWFCDGFAPDRNAAMWDPACFAAIAALSAPGTTLATFTAAGRVRRTLESAGFAVERIDQRPHKRHTLRAERAGADATALRTVPGHVAVAGTGLAGAFVARALAETGCEVTVFDPATVPRVRDAVLHGRALADGSARARLRNTSYLDAAHAYRALGLEATGALEFAGPANDPTRLERLATAFAASGRWLAAVDPVTASALAGVPVCASALYFADAVRVPVDAVCDALLGHARIARVPSALPDASDVADAVVLCTGLAPDAPALRFLEVLPVWGQYETALLPRPPLLPVFGDGFLAPLADGSCVAGATYEQASWDTARASDFNRERFERVWQRLTGSPSGARWIGTVRGVRGVASDRLPVVGRIDERTFVDLAHGSHGTATAPLGARLVTEALGGEFAAIGRAERALIDPGRFRARQARRGLRHGAR